MLPDYYAILGVAPMADLEIIRRAFRKQAVAAHPDCGGSHERMVLVNEAWAILADPETRARYDEARQCRTTVDVQQAAAHDAATARQQAQTYPQHRSELSSWLEIVAADFTSAKYSRSGDGTGPWPTAVNSVSAWIFIAAGAILPAMALLLIFNWQGSLAAGKPFRYGPLLYFAAIVGSWLGYWLHRWIAACLRPPLKRKFREKLFESDPSGAEPPPAAPDAPSPPRTLTIRCPRCSQGLKLPRLGHPLAVTCPKCRSAFDLPPSLVG